MSNPEISRRCTSCGATVRQRAMFCPQCGNSMGETFDDSATQPLLPAAPRTEALAAPAVDEKARTQALTPEQVKARIATTKVGKLKKVSTVVLDQAAYDPSLRFLLVAGLLFLVFLLLLFFSKVLG